MTLDRFRPESAADEQASCQGCQRKLHYTALNPDGFCAECVAEWPDEDVQNCKEKE